MLKEFVRENAVLLNVSASIALSSGSGSPRSEFTVAVGAGAFVGGAACLAKEALVRRLYGIDRSATNENLFENTVKWAALGSGVGGVAAIAKHLIEDLSS